MKQLLLATVLAFMLVWITACAEATIPDQELDQGTVFTAEVEYVLALKTGKGQTILFALVDDTALKKDTVGTDAEGQTLVMTLQQGERESVYVITHQNIDTVGLTVETTQIQVAKKDVYADNAYWQKQNVQGQAYVSTAKKDSLLSTGADSTYTATASEIEIPGLAIVQEADDIYLDTAGRASPTIIEISSSKAAQGIQDDTATMTFLRQAQEQPALQMVDGGYNVDMALAERHKGITGFEEGTDVQAITAQQQDKVQHVEELQIGTMGHTYQA